MLFTFRDAGKDAVGIDLGPEDRQDLRGRRRGDGYFSFRPQQFEAGIGGDIPVLYALRHGFGQRHPFIPLGMIFFQMGRPGVGPRRRCLRSSGSPALPDCMRMQP